MTNCSEKILNLDNELRTSCRLIELGLGELQCISMAEDFYHLPFQLLSSGLERLMKCYICLTYEAIEGKFPDYKYLSRYLGHDLSRLKEEVCNIKPPCQRPDIQYFRICRVAPWPTALSVLCIPEV